MTEGDEDRLTPVYSNDGVPGALEQLVYPSGGSYLIANRQVGGSAFERRLPAIQQRIHQYIPGNLYLLQRLRGIPELESLRSPRSQNQWR